MEGTKRPYGNTDDTKSLSSASETVTRNSSTVGECLAASESSDNQSDIGETTPVTRRENL